MEYVYATLLLHSAGKEISEDNVRKILLSAGIEVDEVRLKSLVAAVKQINIDEVIKTAVFAPAAAVAAPAPQAPQAQQEKQAKPEEEKKEEKKEVSEEELEQGLSALFG
ncbi:MAG: 50S ribosomal protein P1 [Sulfolobales archaeon]